MRVVHTSHDQPREFHSEINDWLEVRRGRTRFPCRPLNSSRYLIGSGSNCHLQLGGTVPMLHSLLVHRDERWTVEVVAPEPTLLVNGESCRHRHLCVGDCIRLAGFEFVLCTAEGGVPKPDQRKPHHQMFASTSLEEDTAGLTASQLLERMEQEIAVVEEFEENRRRGAISLLDAARRQAALAHTKDSCNRADRRAA